jgi:hypothetical protein
MFGRLLTKDKAKSFFVFGEDQTKLTPSQFGYFATRWSIDSASDTTKHIMSFLGNETTLYGKVLHHKINENLILLHSFLIPYHLSAYYVYCAAVLKVPKNILNEIFSGYQEGFSSFVYDGVSISIEEVELLLDKVRFYSQKIHDHLMQELNEPIYENNSHTLSFDSSSRLLLEEIFAAYEPHNKPNISSVTQLSVERMISQSGIHHIYNLKDKIKMNFSS